MKATGPVVCTTQSRYYGTLKCTQKSDTTRRLYHIEPLVGLQHVDMWHTQQVKEDMIMKSRGQSDVEVDIITITSTAT